MRNYINLVNTMLCEAAADDGSDHHGIINLPNDVKFRDGQLRKMVARGNGSIFRAVATPGKKPDEYEINLHPANPGSAKTYQPKPGRNKVAYYDPELADLKVFDQGEEYIERTHAMAKEHLLQEIEPLPEKNMMYRGMSAEEYADSLRKGAVQSEGSYNFDVQQGLTYWTTDVRTAQSYSNSFAAMHWKPAIGHPCYVLAAPLPDPSDTRRVKGTGEHEIGVTRPISVEELVAVWRGRVYDHSTDAFELRPVDSYDHIDRAVSDGDTHRARYGGYSARVVWDRLQ